MKGYTIILNEALQENISSGSFKLLILLSSYCYGDKTECYPSEATLAAKLNRSIRTIQRYVKELVNAGLILVTRRSHRTNLYKLTKKQSPSKTNKIVSSIKEKCNYYAGEAKAKGKNKSAPPFSNFNNFEQREYDYKKLEMQLLGYR